MASNSLGTVANIVMGQSPPGDTVSSSLIGPPLLNGPSEFGPHHPYPVQFTSSPRKLAQPGDILFCVRGSTTGRMNWADQRYAIGRGIAAVRHKGDGSLQPFVRAVLETALPALLSQATGSTFSNVSIQQLASIPIPSLVPAEQRTIAHILGTLDDKIEVNGRMIETLEAMAQAIFKAWFVDFEPVRAGMEGRWRMGESLPGLPAQIHDVVPDRVIQSKLGPIPEGWRIGSLREITDLLREHVSPHSEPDKLFAHHSIPAFDNGQSPAAEFGRDILSAKFVVRTGCILVSKLNPDIERVWLPDVPPGHNGVCSTEFLVLKPKGVHRSFVYSLCRSPGFRRRLEGMVTGTSQSHQRVQPDSVMALPIVIPPNAVLRAYERVASIMLDRSLCCRRERDELREMRDGLLPKLISGDLRVPDGAKVPCAAT